MDCPLRAAPCYATGMIWPFDRWREKGEKQASDTIDEAISFVALRWSAFSQSVAVDPGMDLRQRIAFFSRSIEDSLHRRFPALSAASDQVVLLIVAKGIEASRGIPRADLERSLGIVLPP